MYQLQCIVFLFSLLTTKLTCKLSAKGAACIFSLTEIIAWNKLKSKAISSILFLRETLTPGKSRNQSSFFTGMLAQVLWRLLFGFPHIWLCMYGAQFCDLPVKASQLSKCACANEPARHTHLEKHLLIIDRTCHMISLDTVCYYLCMLNHTLDALGSGYFG